MYHENDRPPGSSQARRTLNPAKTTEITFGAVFINTCNTFNIISTVAKIFINILIIFNQQIKYSKLEYGVALF